MFLTKFNQVLFLKAFINNETVVLTIDLIEKEKIETQFLKQTLCYLIYNYHKRSVTFEANSCEETIGFTRVNHEKSDAIRIIARKRNCESYACVKQAADVKSRYCAKQ